MCMYRILCRCLKDIFYSLLISKLYRENFFKDCGEVVDVRLAVDGDGRFKGFGHVEFATAEAAQNVCLYHCLVHSRHFRTLVP